MKFIIVLLILIIIFGSIGIIYIINFNKMQYLKTKIESSLNIINDCIAERQAIIIKSNTIIKEILDNDKEYLKDYLNINKKNISTFEIDSKITEGLNLIATLKNDNSELDNNKNIIEIFVNIKETDEKITSAKNFFNKNTSSLNLLVRKFPSNVIAKIHNFNISPYFDGKNIEEIKK